MFQQGQQGSNSFDRSRSQTYTAQLPCSRLAPCLPVPSGRTKQLCHAPHPPRTVRSRYKFPQCRRFHWLCWSIDTLSARCKFGRWWGTTRDMSAAAQAQRGEGSASNYLHYFWGRQSGPPLC